jgi:hypothetical protein
MVRSIFGIKHLYFLVIIGNFLRKYFINENIHPLFQRERLSIKLEPDKTVANQSHLRRGTVKFDNFQLSAKLVWVNVTGEIG